MIFYYDGFGSHISSGVERVYQGSIKANTLVFVGSFDKNVEVSVCFEREDGYVSNRLPLKLITDNSISANQIGITAEGVNAWAKDVNQDVTKVGGTVQVQFFISFPNGETLATATSYFVVEEGVEKDVEDVEGLEEVYTYLASINQSVEGLRTDLGAVASTRFINGEGEGSIIMKGVEDGVNKSKDNQAKGVLSLAVGNNNMANADFCIVGGKNCVANAESSVCIGEGLITQVSSQVAFGKYNDKNSSAILQVGCGENDQKRANAIEVSAEGNVRCLKEATFDGKVTVNGNLNVLGTTTTIDTETLNVKDNLIVANSDKKTISTNSGLVINKGSTDESGSSYGIVYSPTDNAVLLGGGNVGEDNVFRFTEKEGLPVAVRLKSEALTDGDVMVWDANAKIIKSSNEYVKTNRYCDRITKVDGIVKPTGLGIFIDNGEVKISCATSADIESKSNFYRPIVPGNMCLAVKKALIDTGGSTGTTWETSDKNKARETLGVDTKSLITEMANLIYPVGSIYMNVLEVSPETLFGGAWERLEDRFLLGAGSTYEAGSTGGSADAVVVNHGHHIQYANLGSGVPYEYRVTKVSVNNANQGYADGVVGTTGVSGEGKNMPPYLTVYMWKRTA